MNRLRLAAVVLASLLLVACGGGPPPDAKTIKIEATGTGSGKIMGSIKASSPGQAGISSKNFEFPIPGSAEVKGGTSEYEIVILGGIPSTAKLQISVDGKVLKPGADMVYEPDKGPRITFDIDTTKK